MKVQRLLALLCVLADVEKITVQELADRFEVSKRTIFRDLEALSCAGIPIVSYPGVGGGVSVIEGYKIGKQILSNDDVQKIFSALDGLRSIDRDSSINNLIAKLVPENEEHIFTKSKYVISLSSWFSDNIIQKKIFSICDAIDNHRCISIEYISKTSHTMRIVEPHKLVFKQSNWYLYAFCRNKNSFRLFKLRRILSYQILEEQFDFKEIGHIDFEENYGSGLFSHHDTDGAFLVILEYDTEDEFILAEKIDASFFSKANEQTSVSQIRFYTTDLSFATDTVFSILDKVRVISPPALYKAVQRRLESINSYYKR